MTGTTEWTPPPEWAAEWAEIKRRAGAGDKEAQQIVELNDLAATGNEFAADLLYLGELAKLADQHRMPLNKRVEMMTEAMHEIMVKHGRIKPH